MIDQTPIERAAQAIKREVGGEADDVWTGEALAAYEAIDTDQLTAIILRTELPGGIKVGHADKIAHAVKNWLIGKEPQ